MQCVTAWLVAVVLQPALTAAALDDAPVATPLHKRAMSVGDGGRGGGAGGGSSRGSLDNAAVIFNLKHLVWDANEKLKAAREELKRAGAEAASKHAASTAEMQVRLCGRRGLAIAECAVRWDGGKAKAGEWSGCGRSWRDWIEWRRGRPDLADVGDVKSYKWWK